MSTKTLIGHGTQLKRGNADGPPETFTTLAEVTNIKGPTSKLGTIDATNQDSASNTLERIAGLVDPGTIQVDLQFADATAYGLLLGDQQARTLKNFQLALPAAVSTKKFAFAAYITQLEPTIPNDKAMTATCNLEISGPFTFS